MIQFANPAILLDSYMVESNKKETYMFIKKTVIGASRTNRYTLVEPNIL